MSRDSRRSRVYYKSSSSSSVVNKTRNSQNDLGYRTAHTIANLQFNKIALLLYCCRDRFSRKSLLFLHIEYWIHCICKSSRQKIKIKYLKWILFCFVLWLPRLETQSRWWCEWLQRPSANLMDISVLNFRSRVTFPGRDEVLVNAFEIGYHVKTKARLTASGEGGKGIRKAMNDEIRKRRE